MTVPSYPGIDPVHLIVLIPFTCILLFHPAAATLDSPRPFVFGINAGTSDRQLQAAKAAGATNVRIGCGWDLVEATPGIYDFRDPDRDVEMCAKHGLEPFFLVVATPKWALAPEKRDRPWAWPPEPEFQPHAARFYRMLAARYRGRVRYYEFWNEENGFGWHAVNHPEDYAPLLKLAYAAFKEGDPDCVVAVGGLDGSGWKGYPRYLERLYELGCGDSFNAVSVHPYRVDGPIDAGGLRKVHDVLVRHGHGHRRLWITEYGWSNEYGHTNKARWLQESLDLLTSPQFDFVFQASVHTLADFDDAEYGLCDATLNPRAACQVFRDYPKDWNHIAARHRERGPAPPNLIPNPSFEERSSPWVPYGDGLSVLSAREINVPAEDGDRVLAASDRVSPSSGGAYLRLPVPEKSPIRVSARVYTDQRGGEGQPGFTRIGLDPTGGTDPKAESVIWGRKMVTWAAWDTTGVGQGDPVFAEADHVTVFLHYEQKGSATDWSVAFDHVRCEATGELFEIPEVRAIPFEQIPKE